MTELVDVPDVFNLEGSEHNLVRCRHDYPDVSVVKGDNLIVRVQDTAEIGQLVVCGVERGFTLRRFTGQESVSGRVVGVWRRV